MWPTRNLDVSIAISRDYNEELPEADVSMRNVDREQQSS